MEEKGYKLTMTEADLNGPERFAADDVATADQCLQLVKLANVSSLCYFLKWSM